jgi:hypothetical protein
VIADSLDTLTNCETSRVHQVKGGKKPEHAAAKHVGRGKGRS